MSKITMTLRKIKNIQVHVETYEALVKKMKYSDSWDSFLCSLIRKAETVDNIEQFGLSDEQIKKLTQIYKENKPW